MIVAVLLVIAAFALLSLVSAASYLERMLPGGLPLGNALAAIGLCAAAWLPASAALAGNLALNFDGARGVAWMALSIVIVVTVLGALAWALAAALLAGYRRAGAA